MDKILTIYLDPHAGHPDLANPLTFVYKGYPLQISEQDYAEFISILPEFWYTENDKITLFTLFADNSYYCERQKKVYNYAIKTFEEVPYRFDSVDEVTLQNFIDILITFFEKVNIKNQNDIQQRLISEVQNYSFLQTFILNTRKFILAKTDFMFLRDYNSVSEDVIKKWEYYRQEWRDITKQDAWQLGELHKVKIPVSPSEKDNFTYSVMAELGHQNTEIEKYIQSIQGSENVEEKMAEVINRYCEYLLKQNIITALSKFKLPLLDLKLNNFYEDEESFINDLTTDFTEFANKIDAELKRIDTDLTVNALISYYKNMTNNQNLAQEVIDVLNELQNTSKSGEE